MTDGRGRRGAEGAGVIQIEVWVEVQVEVGGGYPWTL